MTTSDFRLPSSDFPPDFRPPTSDFPQNPFPGLRPFTTEEDHLFFGRDEQTAALLRLLREHRFLAVVGTSGSGKSSLVRAGLIPALHRGSMAQAGPAWEVVIFRPGGNPVASLVQALLQAGLYDPGDPGEPERLRATLDRSLFGLVEAVRQSRALEPGTNLLVVVDQFEELFRFRREGTESQQTAAAFVKLLLAASASPDLPAAPLEEEGAGERPVYVLITMRSDYLGDCSQIPGLAEAVNRGEYLIPRLTRDQRRQAIEMPVGVGGARIAPRLVQQMLNDLGDDPDQLPVLQHALMRTWEVWSAGHRESEPLDLRHYEATGEMGEAISRHADEIYFKVEGLLPTSDLRLPTSLTERVFKALTVKGPDNRGIRRPTRLDRLAKIAGAPEAEAAAVVEGFRRPGVTFLMPGVQQELSSDTVVDLSHESLMRIWRRLSGWVEEEAQSARIYRRLAETALLWRKGEAGLYRDPDLQIARSWQAAARPGPEWAEQYGGGFEAAMEFLDRSRDAAESEERSREEARRRELEQARRLAEAEGRRLAVERRARKRLGVLVVVVTAVAALAVGAFFFALEARRQAVSNAELARNKEHAATEAATELRSTLVVNDLEQGAQRIESGSGAEGLAYFGRALRTDPGFWPAAAQAWRALASGRFPLKSFPPIEQEKPLTSFLLSPEGGILFTSDFTAESGGKDRFLWDARNARKLCAVGGGVRDLLVSNDSFAEGEERFIGIDREKGSIRSWKVHSGREDPPLAPEGFSDFKTAKHPRDGTLVLGKRRDGALQIFKLDAGAALFLLERDGRPPCDSFGFAFANDVVWGAYADGTIALWETPSGAPKGTISTRPYRPGVDPRGGVSVTPDGKALLCLAAGGRRAQWFFPGQEAPAGEWIDLPDPSEARYLSSGKVAFVSRIESGRPAVLHASVYDLDSRKRTAFLESPRTVSRTFFPETDSHLLRFPLVGMIDANIVRVWDLEAGALLREFFTPGVLAFGSFSPEGRRAFTVSMGGDFMLWDLFAYPENQLLPEPLRRHRDVEYSFSPEGERLLSSDLEKHLHELWNSRDGVRLKEPTEAKGFLKRVRFGVRENRMLLLEEAWTILGTSRRRSFGQGRIVDLTERPAIPEILLPRGVGDGSSAFFTPDGRDLVLYGKARASDAAQFMVWDASTRRVRISRPLPPGVRRNNADTFAISSDGKRAILGSNDRRARVWDVRSGSLIHDLPHEERVAIACFSRDGTRVATGTYGGRLQVWEVEKGSRLAEPIDLGDRITAVKFSPDGLLIGTGTTRSNFFLCDRQTMAKKFEVSLNGQNVIDLDFSPDGAYVAVVPFSQEVLILETATGRVDRKLSHAVYCRNASFSPDGSLLAVGGGDDPDRRVGQVQLWNWRDGSAVGPPLDARGNVRRIVFTRDGALLAASTGHNTKGAILAWEVPSGRPLIEAVVGRAPANSVSFNDDGTQLVGSWDDGAVRLIDLPPRGPAQPPWLARLAEAMGGKRMASGQGGVQPVPPGELEAVRDEIRAAAGLAKVPAPAGESWGRWISTDPADRPISPGSTVTLSEHLSALHRGNHVEDLQDALLLAPSDGLAHARLGLLLLDGLPKEGQVQIPPQFGSEPLLRRHWKATAEWYGRRALELGEKDPEVWAVRAEILLRLGRREEAAAASARALELESGAGFPSAIARYVQAVSLAGQGKWQEADAAMAKALEIVARPAAGPARPAAPLLAPLADLQPGRTPEEFRDLRLPPPIPGTFEDFESAPEGWLPPGWKATSLGVDPPVPGSAAGRLDDIQSEAFEGWLVAALSQQTASRPLPHFPARLLLPCQRDRVNGRFLSSLLEGRFLFAVSGDRETTSVQYVETPDFDCSGRSGIHVSFHSSSEQSEYSLTGLEYSIDGGKTWSAVRYWIQQTHLVRDAAGKVDAKATLEKVWRSVPLLLDGDGPGRGRAYADFLGAKAGRDLDAAIEGLPMHEAAAAKRVELFRLPRADGQRTVRLRFLQADRFGWYWAIDDFGLYQIPEGQVEAPPPEVLDRTRDPETLAAAGLKTLLGADPRPRWLTTPEAFSALGLESARSPTASGEAKVLLERRALDARLFLQRAASLAPEDPAFLLPFSLASTRVGDLGTAMEAARKFLARRPLSFGDAFPLAAVLLAQAEALQAKGEGGPAAVLFETSELLSRRSAPALAPGVLRRRLAAEGREVAGKILLPQGSEWSYLDEGRDPGPGWKEPDFDDRAWLKGKARLGYGGDGEATVVRFGPDSNKKCVTTYFRAAFECSGPQAMLRLSVQRDDGVVVYLNGQEIARDNLPSGEIRMDTLALLNDQENEQRFTVFDLSAEALKPGRNVLAAEIHQQAPDSSDLGFDLELEGLDRPPESHRPDLEIASDEERLDLPAWLRGSLWAFRAGERRAAGDREGAARALERSAALGPENPAISYERALLLLASGEAAAGYAEYQKAVQETIGLKARPRGSYATLLPGLVANAIQPILKPTGLTLAAAASRAASGPLSATKETEVQWLLRWSEALDPTGHQARLERVEARAVLGKRAEALAAAEAVIAAGEPAAGSPPRVFREYREWLALRERLLRAQGRTDNADRTRDLIFRQPPRDPKLSARHLDLTAHINASLYDPRNWHSDVHLAFLPETFRPRGGIGFDLRGLVQLNSGVFPAQSQDRDMRKMDLNQKYQKSFPDEVSGIAAGFEARSLHFLIGAAHARAAQAGTEVAHFAVHYRDGQVALVPLRIGEDLADWAPAEHMPFDSSRIAWLGPRSMRVLFQKTWRNPRPEEPIATLDFVSGKKEGAPFLLAVTAE